ncbi:MAG: AAA family ATPase [Succinivibrionaceae bacterium]
MKLKLLPKLISQYTKFVERNFAFIDKTRFIELIEDKGLDVPLFLRPRRFGKTLFTDILAQYYDVNTRDDFERLFGNTYIGKNPTPTRNSYYILRLDFSGINSKNLEQNFFDNIKNSLLRFCSNYNFLNIELDNNTSDSSSLINFFFTDFQAKRKSKNDKIFIIIDEYDNFANDVLATNISQFKEMTSADGFVKNFYAMLKAESNNPNSAISRFFITGVSSIMINSVTSGFNSDNISQEPDFNEMIGFTEEELRELIHLTMDMSKYEGIFTEDELIEKMKTYFDGYAFCEDYKNHLFNASMSINYLNRVISNSKLSNNYDDANTNLDIFKFSNLMNLINKDGRLEIIKSIAQVDNENGNESYIDCPLVENLNINIEREYTRGEGVSMLFYLGYLTYGLDKYGNLVFRVPNLNYKRMFMQYYVSTFFAKNALSSSFNDLCSLEEDGNITKLISHMNRVITGIIPANEKDVTERSIVSIAGTLILTNLKHCNTYVEYEIRKNKELTNEKADLVIINDHKQKPSFLIEFKYHRETAVHKDTTKEKTVEALKTATKLQLEQYAQDDRLKTIQNLHKYIIIYAFGELMYEEYL